MNKIINFVVGQGIKLYFFVGVKLSVTSSWSFKI